MTGVLLVRIMRMTEILGDVLTASKVIGWLLTYQVIAMHSWLSLDSAASLEAHAAGTITRYALSQVILTMRCSVFALP